LTERIPFNQPTRVGPELERIEAAIRKGWISGDGEFTRRCQELLESELGVPRCFLTTSCTHALDMAAMLLEVGPGDEVILPSYTFVSTANAFALRGVKPVFADSRPDTLNLDEERLEALVSPSTRAIVVVHYAGVGCAMDRVSEIAERHHLAIVEDNAHGLFGKYRGRWLGTFGALATQSFHETKNFTCGEGGALLVNDSSLVGRAEVLREKGTDRSRFFRGEVDKYTWVDIGSSYLPSDLLAAFLLVQLEARAAVQARRREMWEGYYEGLADWAREQGVGLPFIPPECEQAYHLFYVMMPSLESRTALIAHLREHGIHAVFHYVPLHLSPMGRSYGGRPGSCPVAEAAGDRLVRLPFFNALSPDDHRRVIDAVRDFHS
jgi:dTDP-4-amino-4,6-dideoxygalactose transaminase